ncbi:hypothetical protein C8R45DRAFT_945387 [Mycena sanguinolenta]|nr:hypothetical protein C8R45DRAFT_945387 [Mycena sanguinolenta]
MNGGLHQSLLQNSFRRPAIHIVVSPLLSPPHALEGLNGSNGSCEISVPQATFSQSSLASLALTFGGGIGGAGGPGTNGEGGDGGVGEGASLVRHANTLNLTVNHPKLLKSDIPMFPGARLIGQGKRHLMSWGLRWARGTLVTPAIHWQHTSSKQHSASKPKFNDAEGVYASGIEWMCASRVSELYSGVEDDMKHCERYGLEDFGKNQTTN